MSSNPWVDKIFIESTYLFKITLPLIKFLTIKIGDLFIFLFKRVFTTVLNFLLWVQDILTYAYQSSGRVLKNLDRSLSGNHKRGRPRKSPFIKYLLFRAWQGFRSLGRAVRRLIPKPLRIAFVLTIMLVGFLTYTFIAFQIAYQLPNPKHLVAPDRPLSTEFYDRNGKLLYRMYEGKNRVLINLKDLPPYMIQATIAIEDKNFYKHRGIDLAAIIRALRHNFSAGDIQGASTITQQLVKNTLLTPDRTYARKIKEIILAYWAERIYTKVEILQMYFNEAPYGGPTWGVEAAAQTYFGKSAKNLSLAEAAFLAGLPASPTQFSPYGSHPELAKERQKEVLKRMVEENYITQSQADEAEQQILSLRSPLYDIHAPHFVMYVKDYLSEKYGERAVHQGGLKVYTTLDLGLQDQIQSVVSDEVGKLTNLDVQNGAAMVLDAKTGQILAMVGSKDYFNPNFGNYNNALALRPPGSSIKPVTYAAAFKAGYSPGNTVLDTPVNFGGYAPVNYDGTFHGPVSIRTALGSSYNIPAVKILASIGIDPMLQTARDLGISTFNDRSRYGLSITLGAAEVNMVDMTGMYSVFSQMGKYQKPTAILRVVDSDRNTLEEYKNNSSQVLQPEIAYLIDSILSDNNARTPAFGPKSLLFLDQQPVAVKTGTSDLKRDNWTFGYTSDFVVGVWVGNNNNKPMNPALTSGITGAAPIWSRIMKGLVAKIPPKPFVKPPGVIDVIVDGRKDIAVAGILSKGLVRIANEKNNTVFFDAFSSYATSSAITSTVDGLRN